MSSGVDKVKLRVSGCGSWHEFNGEWQFVTDQPTIAVKVPSNVTYSRLVQYLQSKCGIDASVGITRMAYKNDGGFYFLDDTNDLSNFMAYIACLDTPPTLYVYQEFTSCDAGNVGGSSNTEESQGCYVSHFDSQNEHRFGLTSDSIPDYVPETQQIEEEEQETDEERVVVETDDEAHVFHLGISDVDTDVETDEEGIPETNHVHSFGGVNDFFDMPPTIPDVDPSMSSGEPVIPYVRSGKVKETDLFDTKDELTLALSYKFIDEGFEFKTKKSDKRRYVATCVHDNCEWRLSATAVKNKKMFLVQKMHDVHTCSRTQLQPNHRQANRRVLGHLLLPKVQDVGRKLRGKDIFNDIKQQHKINISYWQAWRAKAYALALVHGSPEESFGRLPAYLYNLELQNPGSYTETRTDDSHRFELCFVALGVSIRAFLSYLRPVLIIDAAHLKGSYLGTMFLAVAMDANQQIVPIAIGVGRSESGDAWTWFLSRLKERIPDHEGLVFISDRALSIKQAISIVYPNARHGLCCRHLLMNVKTRVGSLKYKKNLFWKTCRAYTVYDFERRMDALRSELPVGAQSMDEVGKEKWSRAYFPGNRYQMMTSNNAESINALSRHARILPIVALMDYFRAFQQEWYSIRRNKAGGTRNDLSPYAEKIVERRTNKSATYSVHEIGGGAYEVQDFRRNAEVNMILRSCTCRKWELSGLPCAHAIAVAREERYRNLNGMASGFFTTAVWRATYEDVIRPVGPAETWVVPNYPLMTVKPPVIKRRAGRPSNHDRIPSRGEDPIVSRCSRCHQVGHNRANCTAPKPASERASGSRQTRPVSTQHYDESFRHDTFDLNVDLNESFM